MKLGGVITKDNKLWVNVWYIKTIKDNRGIIKDVKWIQGNMVYMHIQGPAEVTPV